jgi:hypothetical protein
MAAGHRKPARKRVGLVEQAKTLLSKEKYRIALHDVVAAETKKTAAALTVESFRCKGLKDRIKNSSAE